MDAPFSCDPSLALGAATFDGSTMFAKNCGRTANEAQPLFHTPRDPTDPARWRHASTSSFRTWKRPGS